MLEENHYYPFGLAMAGICDKALKLNYPENKYRYNGGTELQNKEFSDGSGLELYDANARMYDPQIGRFGGIDAMSDQTRCLSPYQFAYNDPTLFNDPGGMKAANPNSNTYNSAEQQYINGLANPMEHGDGWGEEFMAGGGGGEGDGRSASAVDGGYEFTGEAAHQLISGLQNAMNNANGNWFKLGINNDGDIGYWALMPIQGAPADPTTKTLSDVNLQPQFFALNDFVSLGGTENNSDWFKNISDQAKYPGISIYQTSLIKFGTAVTLPGLGIFISSAYEDKELTKVTQHEYGHFLVAKYGMIEGKNVNTLTQYSLFYLLEALPSIWNAAENPSDHPCFWTEIQANFFAEQFFGESYIHDEKYYPTYDHCLIK